MHFRNLHQPVGSAASLLILMLFPVLVWGSAAPPGRALIDDEITSIPVTDAADLRFVRLSRSQGLSQQRVSHIVQDDRGFMWFGTQYGLNRYDGYHFRVFKHDPLDADSLGGVFISALFKDRSGRIWIGCDSSLDRYDPLTETFVHYRLRPHGAINQGGGVVRHISQDRDGKLWLSTAIGLYSLDIESGELTWFHHDDADPTSLSSDVVKHTGEDRAGNFWVAGAEGLDQFDRTSGRVTFRVPLQESRDLSFYEDRTGIFWIIYASGNGLATLDRQSRRVTRIAVGLRSSAESPLTGISSMLEDDSGTLWLGTFSDGILRYDREQHRFTRWRNDPANNESLSENRITTLFEDREGNIWSGFGATEPAFFATQPLPFTKLPFDSGNRHNLGETLVNVLYEDHEGILWMGTTGALSRLDRKSGQLTHLEVPGEGLSADVLSLIEDRSNALWIGTSGLGLYRRDPLTGRLQRFRHAEGDPNSLSNDFVIRMFIDHAGNLWIGTAAGLNRYDPASQSFRVYQYHDNADPSIYAAIAQDGQGNLWFGTYGSGVLRFDRDTGLFIPVHRAGVPIQFDHRVNTVLVDHAGALWAGTQNGLERWDPAAGTIKRYSENDGLASNAVSCLLEDAAGELWMGTSAGLSRLDVERRHFKNYSQADGLPGPDLTGWSACFRGRSGELFVGGFAGAVAFDPRRVADVGFSPPVALTSFQMFGVPVSLGTGSPLSRAIDFTHELTLAHNQNSFSFEFAALSFRSPLTNRYRYVLEGVDPGWREVGSDQRLASYTTLPPGNYRFKVQGATSRGPWGEPGLSVAIRIEPPWWATWWFRALMALLGVFAVVGAYQGRVRQITAALNIRTDERVRERTRIARELHDSLLQGFQGLLFRLQAVQDLLPGRAKEAMSALESVMERGDQVIAEGRATVLELRSNATAGSELSETLTALIDELTSQSGERSAAYRIRVEGKSRIIAPMIREDVYQIAREAIRNATQHAQAKRIEAELHYGENHFELRIRDDGVGIDTGVRNAQGRPGHWGMQGMQERAQSIKGHLDVWSEQGVGTEVALSIPAAVAYCVEPETMRPAPLWLRLWGLE